MVYKNGNASISIDTEGTRTINFEKELLLEYPLNIDIRVSTKCAFGLNPITAKAFCSFCHESARTDGQECDYEELKSVLKDLPKGIELAIGSNELTNSLYNFLSWCYDKEFIYNLTINQGHIRRDQINIISALQDKYIKGLGISYRSELKWDVPESILGYANTVFHVISGIDTFKEVKQLKDKGVKKILILGEKDFGFNLGCVDLTTQKHKEWYWWIGDMFQYFEVVSFDNLAIQQLNIKRYFKEEDWAKFYQGEYSFYINAVEKYFSPSSRNSLKTPYLDIKDYFKQLHYVSNR